MAHDPRALCVPIQDARGPRHARRLWRLAHGVILSNQMRVGRLARGGPQSKSHQAGLRTQVNPQRLRIVPT
eukprot:8335585-Pyramimonas_sp.AAC.1